MFENVAKIIWLHDLLNPCLCNTDDFLVIMPESSPLKRRITQKDLARKLGLSQSSISLTFANSPRVPKKTRERVLAAAEALGYRPDPMLKSLAIYRQRHSPPHFQAVLGWITPYNMEGVPPVSFHYQALQGATARAEALGYQLDPIWLKAPNMTNRRLDGMLKARGIRGLIIPPADHLTHLNLDWDIYTAVVLGDYTIARPRLDRVAVDHFRAMELALRKIKRLGFKRIGFICEEESDRRLLRGFSAAFLSAKSFLKDKVARDVIRVNISVHLEISPRDLNLIKKWLIKFKPDAVIYNDVKKRTVIREAMPELVKLLPKAEFFACLPLSNPESEFFSGINEDWPGLAAYSVEILIAKLQQSSFGLPARPRRILVEGEWQDAGAGHKTKSSELPK